MSEHTPEVELRVHNGRGINASDDPETGEAVAGWPEVAYESIRALNHLTFGATIPAPVVYDVLGNLKLVGTHLPQLFQQLAAGLERSLIEYDVYDRRTADPPGSVQAAHQYLLDAASAARQLGASLESAQSEISGQGYNGPREADVVQGPWGDR